MLKEIEKVINDMLDSIERAEKSFHSTEIGRHHKIEYKMKLIEKANKDINYYRKNT